MTDTTALRELLERATALEAEIEVKAGELGEDPSVPDAEPDADGDEATVEALAAKVAELEDALFAMQNASAPGVDPVADAEAADAFEIDDSDPVDESEWGDGDEPAAGVDFEEVDVLPDAAPAPAGDVDLVTPTDQQKGAFSACPSCGSSDADEYADGTARCADCGTPLGAEEKGLDDELDGFDFDELEAKGFDFDDDELEAKADDELEALLAAEGALEVKSLEDGGSDTLSEMELLMARRAQLDA